MLNIVLRASKQGSAHLPDVFVQNLEHEIRTPLAIVLGYAETLREGALGELCPEQQQAVEIIARRAGQLRELVERFDVLLAAQAGQGLRQPLDLARLAAESVAARQACAERAGVALEYQDPLGLGKPKDLLIGEPTHLRCALDCLVENAIKFTPRGGRVEVNVLPRAAAERGAGGEVGFAVRDTGIGLAPHDVAILRNGSTFYQADSSSKRRYGGLGLGLTLVKAVVKAHGGQLDIESELGRGSCFALRLPMGQADSGLACRIGGVVQ